MTTDKAGAHTQGRLVVFHFKDSLYDLRMEKSPGVFFGHGVASFIQHGNARRLAAAWNFCEGVDTDVLETHADLRQRIDAYANSLAEMAIERDRVARELAAARALLAESLTTEDDIGVAERIVAFLKGKK